MKVKKKQSKFKTTKEFREETFDIMKNIPEITIGDEWVKAQRPELSEEEIKKLTEKDPLASEFYKKYKSFVIDTRFSKVMKEQIKKDDLMTQKNELSGDNFITDKSNNFED